MITEVISEKNNPQNNVTSNVNTEGEHFSHFGTIGANPFEGFGIFGEGNNNPPSGNNNNNNPPLLSSSGFGEGLGEGFNLLLGENAEGLDLNVVVLVNALAGANLSTNYIKRESNYIKLTEFGRTKAEDPNEWLE